MRKFGLLWLSGAHGITGAMYVPLTSTIVKFMPSTVSRVTFALSADALLSGCIFGDGDD
jgi:hypothetical protein